MEEASGAHHRAVVGAETGPWHNHFDWNSLVHFFPKMAVRRHAAAKNNTFHVIPLDHLNRPLHHAVNHCLLEGVRYIRNLLWVGRRVL